MPISDLNSILLSQAIHNFTSQAIIKNVILTNSRQLVSSIESLSDLHISNDTVYHIKDTEGKDQKQFGDWIFHGLSDKNALMRIYISELDKSNEFDKEWINDYIDTINKLKMKFEFLCDLANIKENKFIKKPKKSGSKRNPVAKGNVTNIFLYRWLKEVEQLPNKLSQLQEAVAQIDTAFKNIDPLIKRLQKTIVIKYRKSIRDNITSQ